jgi:hypothetical protein
LYSLGIFFFCSAFIPGSSLACDSGPGTFDIPIFVVAAFAAAVVIVVLTLVVFLVQQRFFNDAFAGRSRRTRICLVAAVMTSLMLAAIGTVVVPAFRSFYTSFGVELASATGVLVAARFSLWLPALLLLLSLVRSNQRVYQARFLAAVLIGEGILLLLVLWVLYLPVVLLRCG